MHMRIPDSSKRSGGRPISRLRVALAVVGLASLGVGACSGRQQTAQGHAPGTADTQEAPLAKCPGGGTPAERVTFTVTPMGITRDPITCIKHDKTARFVAQCGNNAVTITVDGGTRSSPFKDGTMSINLPGDGGIVEKDIKSSDATGSYELSAPETSCPAVRYAGDAGTEIGPINGTLEVATSTYGEPE
jgi:hypothetical protein